MFILVILGHICNLTQGFLSCFLGNALSGKSVQILGNGTIKSFGHFGLTFTQKSDLRFGPWAGYLRNLASEDRVFAGLKHSEVLLLVKVNSDA
jgi:hypothetical protein